MDNFICNGRTDNVLKYEFWKLRNICPTYCIYKNMKPARSSISVYRCVDQFLQKTMLRLKKHIKFLAFRLSWILNINIGTTFGIIANYFQKYFYMTHLADEIVQKIVNYSITEHQDVIDSSEGIPHSFKHVKLRITNNSITSILQRKFILTCIISEIIVTIISTRTCIYYSS